MLTRAPEQIARPLRRMELDRVDALGRDPEILAGGGQHLERAGAAGRRRRGNRRTPCRRACPARAAAAPRPPRRCRAASAGVAGAQRDQRRQQLRRCGSVGSPRNSGTRPSRRSCRRAMSARSSWRNSATTTAACGSTLAAASRMTSARSRLPANSSSSASSTRAREIGRAPCARRRWPPSIGVAELAGAEQRAGGLRSASRSSVMRDPPRHAARAPGRGDFGHEAERGGHVVELVVRLQLDRCSRRRRACRAARAP